MTGISLTNSLAQEYERAGVVQRRSVLDPADVARIGDTFMEQVERDVSLGFDDNIPAGDPLARYPRFVHPHRRADTAAGRLAAELMFDPRIFDTVTELIGPALGAQSMFYFKPPTARGQAMHQDNLSLRTHPETCLAAWIAIDDCDAENGGLMVVPGSHTTEIACPEAADPTQSFASGQVRIPAGMSVVQTEMRAGDTLFFHGSLVHGSLPNTSTTRFRRSLIFHYIPEAATEISKFYDPLVSPSGAAVSRADARGGGPCGDGFEPIV
jgi:ectoine hydroxylase-related dioxygenase (phytanoyl-CoA dioxygenase family)